MEAFVVVCLCGLSWVMPAAQSKLGIFTSPDSIFSVQVLFCACSVQPGTNGASLNGSWAPEGCLCDDEDSATRQPPAERCKGPGHIAEGRANAKVGEFEIVQEIAAHLAQPAEIRAKFLPRRPTVARQEASRSESSALLQFFLA
jgi:hypothetical protein